MSKVKKFFVLMLILSITVSCFGTVVSAYEYISTDGWTEKSAFGSEFIVSEAYGKKCISVNSVGNLSLYDKTLDESIAPVPEEEKLLEAKIYELSCKVYVPHITTDSVKQTFILEGRTNSGNIPVLYGIRIDNGVVAYYNGTGSYSISTAYNGNEKLSISEGKWHTFKTVINRNENTCRYYVDGMPIVSGGEILSVTGYYKTYEKAINKLTINSRNASDSADDRVYVSDICVRRITEDYKETFVSFEGDGGTGGWNLVSGTGEVSTASTDGAHGNSLYIASSGKASVFAKSLAEGKEINADNGIYALGYDVYLPNNVQPEDSNTQSVEVLGFRADGTINAYYGPKISNRKVLYYTGLGNYDNATVYSGNEKLVLSAGWHRIETVYDRGEETFSYYIDGEPLRTPKGDALKVKVWKSVASYTIKRIAIGMRNDYGDTEHSAFVDNIYFRKIERAPTSDGVRLYNVAARNAGGEEVSMTDVSNEEDLTVSFDYDASKNFTAVAAVYKEGRLLSINTKRVDVTERGFSCTDSMDISCDGGESVKLIAIDSIKNIKPYSAVTREEAAEPVTIRLRGSDVSDANFTVIGDETSLAYASVGNTMTTRLKAPVMDSDETKNKQKKFDSTAGGPESAYYINFKVNNEKYLRRSDGAVYAVTVKYSDEGYGCFTLEYNSTDESFKEAEYVELKNRKKFYDKTFYLKNAYFTGEGTDFRIATWGENMRYSNFDVIIARVTMDIEPYCDRFNISAMGNALGNIYYTGDTATFTVKINDKNFYDYSVAQGSYTAKLKYSLVDESGELVTEIGEKNIAITPLGTMSDTVSFDMNKYGLYYLKTEVTADEFDIKSENLTELSYVHSDKTTVNPDYGISFQNNIYYAAGAENLAKNAGIGMLRWVRPMKNVMKIEGKDENAAAVEIGNGDNKYSSNNSAHEWRTLEAMAANKGYTFLNNLSAGGMIYSDTLVNGYKKQIPYGDIGKNLFADYCGFFAHNAPADTRYYEIWNEFDSGVGTTFNMNGENKKYYGDLLVKAADAIYSEDDDAEIVAMSARFINTHDSAISRVKELIANGSANRPLADYFKNASIHPYHWNDNPMELKTVNEEALRNANTLYDHMEILKNVYTKPEYGLNDTKLWISEIAWSPHFISKFYLDDIKAAQQLQEPQREQRLQEIKDNINDYKPITEKQQGSYLVQSYVMAKKNNITEKFLSYLFARQTTARIDRDKNCGIIKYYKDTGNNVPYAATSAYLAIANMNMLMAGRTYANDFMFASGTAAAYKYTKAGSPDLAVLWSTKESGENVSINLGVGSVTMYDEYGNAKTLTSDNGIYSLKLTQSTVYLKGNSEDSLEGSFGAFARAN